MSEENVELILQGIEAVNCQDAEAFVATANPDIEWEDAVFGSESARVYRGKAELREWFNKVVVEPWESLHCELAEIIETTTDRVVWEGVLTARGRDSGVETQQRFWTVQWFAGGMTTRRRVFFERDEALEAAGFGQ